MSLKKDPKDRARRKSISLPPDVAEYVNLKAMTMGNWSRVCQAAVRLLMAEDPDPKGAGLDVFSILHKANQQRQMPARQKGSKNAKKKTL